MVIDLAHSKTKENLMKAFAGECQARARYSMSASIANGEGLQLIGKAFDFTASQEKEHAEVFYKHLKPFAGELIHINADYPIDIYKKTLDMLKSARQNEYEEFGSIYKGFGDDAKSEDFNDIANLFYDVAKIEKTHGDRFDSFISLIDNDGLFKSGTEESWVCLNCGNIITDKNAPKKCHVCDHVQGYFIRCDGIKLC